MGNSFWLLLLLAFTSSLASAQGRVTATFENPANFIKTGESDYLLIRISNPADSGFTVHRHSGPGFSTSTEPVQLPIDVRYFSSPADCNNPLVPVCLEEGSFPIAPGESAVIRLFAVNAVAELPIGGAIVFSDLNLSAINELGERQRMFPPGSAVFIVSEDGLGDPAVFAQYDINPDVPPYTPPRLDASFIYPSQLLAGQAFHLIAELRNSGTTALTQIFVSQPYRVSRSSGNHLNSFDIKPCNSDCILLGKLPLAPGETLFMDIGNWYYGADSLFNGNLILQGLNVSAQDSLGRFDEAVIVSEGVAINISSPAGTVPNYDYESVALQPLEVRDHLSAGDQLLVHDYNTGFDWLKLSATEGMTFDEVVQHTNPGGDFYGYYLATARQVEEFILHYVRNQGMRLLPHQILVYSDQLNERLKTFAEFQGAQGVRGGGLFSSSSSLISTNVSYIQHYTGVVRNTPVDADLDPRRKTFVRFETFHNDNSPMSFASSTSPRVSRVTQTLNDSTGEALYWLVRTNQPPRFLPGDVARYFSEELVLPALEVGDKKYFARLNFRNALSNLVQLVSAKEVSAPYNSGTFSFDTGLLQIPLVLMLSDTFNDDYFQVELQHIEGTEPPLFQLLTAHPVR